MESPVLCCLSTPLSHHFSSPHSTRIPSLFFSLHFTVKANLCSMPVLWSHWFLVLIYSNFGELRHYHFVSIHNWYIFLPLFHLQMFIVNYISMQRLGDSQQHGAHALYVGNFQIPGTIYHQHHKMWHWRPPKPLGLPTNHQQLVCNLFAGMKWYQDEKLQKPNQNDLWNNKWENISSWIELYD